MTIFFLTTGTSIGPRAPAGQSGSRQSGHWVLRKPGPDWAVPNARGPAGLLRPLPAEDSKIDDSHDSGGNGVVRVLLSAKKHVLFAWSNII